MRLYCFGNMYLSSIQQGIQSLHATVEMFLKYDDVDVEIEQQLMLMDWATNHKTVQLMNGGYGKHIRELHSWFEQQTNDGLCKFPFADFHEEADALDGAITCVSIVLPERIYLLAKAVSNKWISLDQLTTQGASENDVMLVLSAAETNIRAMHETLSNFDIFNAVSLLNSFEIELINKLPSYKFAG